MRPPTVCVENVCTYPIPHLRLLALPILTPTCCSIFYITIAFLLFIWLITLIAGRTEHCLAARRQLILTQRQAAVQAGKSQRSLELKEQNLRSLQKDLEKYSDASEPATPAEVHAGTEDPNEVKSRLEGLIRDLGEDIERLKATQKYEAVVAEDKL